MKVLLGAILLLLVGCSGVVQAQGQDTDAQIAALTERVAELEDQVRALRWTQQDAINAVAYKVWERTTTCACYVEDPVLQAFLALDFDYESDRRYYAVNAFHNARWSASPNEDGDSFTVLPSFPSGIRMAIR